MDNYRTIIKVEGRSIEDLFRLPCVLSIVKCSHPEILGPFTLLLNDYKTNVYVGDFLCEDYDGNWHCVKKDGENLEK